jgi:manganese transport protein
VIGGAFLLLLYLVFKPLVKDRHAGEKETLHGAFIPLEFADGPTYKRIAVTIDFSDMDSKAIQSAITTGGKDAHYLLIHVVESAGAWTMGSEVADSETSSDYKDLHHYAQQMHAKGYHVEIKLGYGNPKRQIPKLVEEFKADLIVMGAHGHQLIKDILLGTTVDSVRHKLSITMIVVRA